MQPFIDVYGDTMHQKHTNCRNCCVLIQIGDLSQCGIILACGDKFCYILTTASSQLYNASMDVIITFGDERELRYSTSSVVVQSGNKLSILLLRHENITNQAKQSVNFSIQDKMEDAVIYTLSYIPKTTYNYKYRGTQCSSKDNVQPANSYFRGGNPGVVGLQHNGVDMFYHNCCAGNDVTKGSVVLNGRCEVIGMNLAHSAGWTMALCLSVIKDEIALMFPDAANKTFAGIQEYFKAKGEVDGNKTMV